MNNVNKMLLLVLYIIILLLLNIDIKVYNVKNTSFNNKYGIAPTYNVYRMTSYYTGDSTNSGECTASGICTNKFDTNEYGWYTYKDKLVMASGYEYQLYDEIQVIIDGVAYDAIILDKCGACRKDTRLDLFVDGKESFLDRGYKGINPIYVKGE